MFAAASRLISALVVAGSAARAAPPAWHNLLNGRDLTGWHLTGPSNLATAVVDADGTLELHMRPGTSEHTFVTTDETFGDFILELDFLDEGDVHTGVLLRSVPAPADATVRLLGYQIKIDPTTRAWTGGIFDDYGANWRWLQNLADNPAGRAAYRPGAWNHLRAEALGSTLKVWINDVPTCHLVDDRYPRGAIALKIHALGDRPAQAAVAVKYRHLRILTDDVAAHGRAMDLPARPAVDARGPFVYAFFRDPGTTGIGLALSEDGTRWTPLNDDHPVIPPPADAPRTRDPFLLRDPHGHGFHLVWTSGGQPPRIGYAHSDDLVHWTAPRFFTPFAGDVPVQNVWAPELVWDEARGEWLVLWSSTVDGQFPATAGQVAHGRNHRIYAATTTDFSELGAAFLFYDPGFPVIDATVVPDPARHRWLMVVKDERDTPLRKRLQLTTAPSPRGPWAPLGEPLTPSWTEGPSLLPLADGWLLYYDCYRGDAVGMHARFTRDFTTWTSLDHQLSMPPLSKHGSFLAVTPAEAAALLRLDAAR